MTSVTPLSYASISQSLLENGKSFEEVRVDDYLQSYTRTGRPPQPVAQVPTGDKERSALGLPPLFKPISEHDPILAGRPKESTLSIITTGGRSSSSVGLVNGKKPNPADIPPTQEFKGERVAGETFHTICCTEPYTWWSPEELRYYAYQKGHKYPPSDDLQSITTRPEFAQHSFEVFMATLLAVTMAQGPRTCYKGLNGVGAGPINDCCQFINTFCNDASLTQTPVRIGDATSRCFNLPGGDRCDFIAYNTYNQAVSPSIKSCKIVLEDIGSKCILGGFGAVSDTAYTFTVDRNHGSCGHDVQGGS
ncbi:hypothetical protein NP233_g1318 [Leucocoprinus birnbaumii]|uniref:Glycan binding protein Y3-like domain-containing protein n=1 Tax=Leucocoprinus birnbaumii TaxID=56174 RepID=A0AAD5W0Q3_9AGAR|nr:hypothetical protein NP233_g1318 [Leucocoprinus birnbaumii]